MLRQGAVSRLGSHGQTISRVLQHSDFVTALTAAGFSRQPGVGGRAAVSSAAAKQPPTQPAAATMPQFEVVSEEPLHSRYLSVYSRRVRFTPAAAPAEAATRVVDGPVQPPADTSEAGRVLDYDVVGHPRANFCFAVSFPFHPYTDGRAGGEVTVIREYAQGPNALAYCLPTGALDPRRHIDLADCAARELSEEAWLTGGAWHCLLPAGHPGLPEVKWCMNRFTPFLVVAPQPDPSPGKRDAEEAGMEVLRLPLEEFRALLTSGDMLLPSIATSYLALERLGQLGLL